ncbi:LCP family protein required for cell wall assembly [Microbacterium testaceum]|uniref:LCP family protein n=1 Tax=Microbacterium TaxID=33882 RepID=UPI001AEA1D64|nr:MULTISPECIES: LCP family protein [Microbacterium]MDQ1112283.1 LCP family protein required for cell wall assembly [Microbacterium testaceum]MDQ1175855.1 LCP family protein required for cell wall assembly [Microbacterium sp. SORGH_AS_0421]MDR6097180.1 LCP family protein required for cell wall assembly [Microbacterium sp. SORGH_AS_0454]WAC69806.1 LCP family protein [Microbacterium sp. SL75]
MSKTSTPRGQRTVARHGRLTSPGPLSQLFRGVAIALAVLLVSGGAVLAYAAVDLTQSFTADAVELKGQPAVPPDLGELKGGVNMLLVGTDECEPSFAQLFGDRCTGADSEGSLNDVNMLVHISDAPRRVTVISFPRDLMVPIPSCTDKDGNETSAMSKQQINSAFSYGGLSCVVQTVSELSGLEIPFAAKVSFGGVINITDAIGGVDVCIANGIKDRYTGIDWPAGMRTVQGLDALQFLRTRHGVGDGGDLGRISNQQQYMSRLANKLKSQDVLSNPATLYKLASTALRNVDPSTSLTNPLTLVQIASAVKDVPFNEIVFIQYPTYTDPSNPNRVVPDRTDADTLWAALSANQPLELSGNLSDGNGVVVDKNATPAPTQTPAPVETASPTPTATSQASPAPTSDAIQLPSGIAGQTAAQSTCSNGNVRG